MKRLGIFCAFLITGLFSVNALAAGVGILDAQSLQSSPQVKAINTKLDEQFSDRRNKFVTEGKSLQDDIKKLQRNKSVMSKKDQAALQDKIAKQETALRTQQGALQKEMFDAQNKAMSDFMEEVKAAVAVVAKKKDLDIVVLKGAVVYSKDGMDITSDVMKQLK